jgi:hypothetical protein
MLSSRVRKAITQSGVSRQASVFRKEVLKLIDPTEEDDNAEQASIIDRKKSS